MKLLLTAPLALLPVYAQAQDADINYDYEGTAINLVTYTCAGEVKLPVAFINAGDSSTAVMLYDGQLVAMNSMKTASGATYASIDEQNGYRLSTKGDEAFVEFMAADDSAKLEMKLSACQSAPAE
ncbi:MliC family protein [Paracoccus sp. 11-3]|uniref:MliC family protein n=1 Tax=Paracoccus amoyensis TaxID=2760093 RepID=A0A926GP90_9RHOB|nr:MliC family protein [Paracoccus amoyensis]MBC9247475.1 MliC family protein [Paracoccus amoyensis]